MFILLGGSGFLGSALKSILLGDQQEVIVIGRQKNRDTTQGIFYSTDEFSLSEIRTKLSLEEPCTIIDFAYTSTPITSFERPIKDFSENLHNVISHLEFAVEIKAANYVYISSGGTVYGNVLQSPIAEDASNFPISPYGITKMACERYVNMYHTVYGLKTCIVRPSNVYGPGQVPFRGQGFIATALALAYQGRPMDIFGDGSVIRDYLYIDDFCKGVSDLLRFGKSGEIYNLGHGTGFSINEVIHQINMVVKAEGYELLAGNVTARLFDVQNNVLDCSKLTKISGWHPTMELTDGIRQAWQWIKYFLKNNPS